MRIEVLCFAILRDAVGASRVELELRPDADVAAGVAALAERYPGVRPLLGSLRFAVNAEFAAATQPLADGDTLALLPPVSGG